MSKRIKKFYNIADEDNDNIYSSSDEYEQNEDIDEDEQEYYDEQMDNYDEQEEGYDDEEYNEEYYENTDYERRVSVPLKILMIITYCIMLCFALYGVYSIVCKFT